MPQSERKHDLLVKIRYLQSHGRMRKKILIVTDNLRDQVNGVVVTYKNIEKCARDSGYDIVYIDPGQFRHIDCPGYPEVKLSWPKAMGEKIEALDPDYIHIATEGPLGIAARSYCRSRKLRYNTAYHTKFPEFLKAMYHIPVFLTYAYMRWFHRNSSKVITTTSTMVEDLRAHGFKGNIVPWTRGIDRAVISPTAPKEPNKDIEVLYVGRVSKEKNLDDLCRLQDRFNINIVGDGPYRSYLEQTYQKVTFHGYKQGSGLADQFQRADVFAFPSCSDTFGIVIIEALSLGTPVAAYDVAGPKDIVQNGVNGFLGSDLESNIRNCLTLDRDQVKASSEQYTWQRCWDIFEQNLVLV